MYKIKLGMETKMASKYTDNFNLDLYEDKDPANLRDQYNDAMRKIDDGLFTANQNATSAKNSVNEVKTQVADVKSQVLDINNTSIKTFNTVADVKKYNFDESIKYIKTNGFSTVGDNGACIYEISTTKSSIYSIDLNNNLYANIAIKSYITPEMLVGEIEDYTNVFNYILKHDSIYSKHIILDTNKTYILNNEVACDFDVTFDGNNATVKSNSSANAFTFNHYLGQTHDSLFGDWKNLIIEAPYAKVVFSITNGYKGKMSNVKFINFTNTALKHNTGYEMIFKDLRFEGSKNSLNSIGIEINAGDSEYENIIMRDCHTGILQRAAFTHIYNLHAWIWTKALLTGSIMIDLVEDSNLFGDFIYNDTYEKGIRNQGNARVNINGLFNFVNPNVWGDPSTDNTPENAYIIYFDDPDTNGRVSKYIDITKASLRSDGKVKTFFTNTPNWSGRLETNDFWGVNFQSIPFNKKVSVIEDDNFTKTTGSVIVSNDGLLIINAIYNVKDISNVVFHYQDYHMNLTQAIIGYIINDPYYPTEITPCYGVAENYSDKITFQSHKTGQAFLAINATVPIYQLQQ